MYGWPKELTFSCEPWRRKLRQSRSVSSTAITSTDSTSASTLLPSPSTWREGGGGRGEEGGGRGEGGGGRGEGGKGEEGVGRREGGGRW